MGDFQIQLMVSNELRIMWSDIPGFVSVTFLNYIYSLSCLCDVVTTAYTLQRQEARPLSVRRPRTTLLLIGVLNKGSMKGSWFRAEFALPTDLQRGIYTW
jgi:hypothetical protein